MALTSEEQAGLPPQHQVYRTTGSEVCSRGELEHLLREAWRARAAGTHGSRRKVMQLHGLHAYDWSTVSRRAKKVARLWCLPGPDRP